MRHWRTGVGAFLLMGGLVGLLSSQGDLFQVRELGAGAFSEGYGGRILLVRAFSLILLLLGGLLLLDWIRYGHGE
jgi:hypothetical protein